MLGHAPELVEGMIEIAYQRKWLETTFSAINFAQCVVQGLWYTNHPLLQVPHLSEGDVAGIVSSSSDASKAFPEFLRNPQNYTSHLTKLSPEQQADVIKATDLFPRMKVDTKLFVEEPETDFTDGAPVENDPQEVSGDSIYEQDLVTLRVTLTRENTPVGKDTPPVYAPAFPTTIRENWWLILTDKQQPGAARKPNAEAGIHAVEKVTDISRKIVHELRFMAPQRAGRYEMELHVYSDCYMGLDQSIDLAFDVLPASELPEYVPHPEDVELDNEPTLFEQVMAANVDDSSDEEPDEQQGGNNKNGVAESKANGDESDED